MNLKKIGILIFTTIFTLVILGSSETEKQSTEALSESKPNIVIFLTDDHGTLDVKSYGAEDLFTPNIDQMAKEGIRFSQAYAHTVCVPARAALLTGRHPQRTGINNWTQGDAHAEKGINMDLDETTIAEVLKHQGYKTGLFGKWHLGADLNHGPLSQGFDYFYGFRGGFIDNFQHYFLHGDGYHDLWRNKEEIYESGQYFPDRMIEEAKKYIDKNLDKPKFLYISLNIPHYPEQVYLHKLKFEDIYKDLEEPRRSYAHMVSTSDYLIGEVIQHLKNKGEYENTIFVFMSDNGHSEEDAEITQENHNSGLPKGTYYGAYGGGGFTGEWIGYKSNFREGGIRVPFIISYPARLPMNIKRDQVVTIMDILPTLSDLLNIPLPEKKLDGGSLLPVILDDAPSPYTDEILYFQWQDRWAVRKGDWKLMKGRREFVELHLANLADEDPEQKNWISDYPEIAEKLTEMYESWFEEVMSEGGLLEDLD